MKKIFLIAIAAISLWSCKVNTRDGQSTGTSEVTPAGQSAVQDEESAKDVVKVAASSKDHSTLVAAIKQAGLVDALSNARPFTVFAPTNEAFDALPKGTVEDLMKPENKEKLQDILQYHVFVGNLTTALMHDGQTYNEVNGGNITVSKTADGKIRIINTTNIVTTVSASNGIIHIIDAVLLPPAK